jgi:hypothetical protein
MKYASSNVSNWPGDVAFANANDSTFSQLVGRLKEMQDRIARIDFALANPQMFRDLWLPNQMTVEPKLADKLNKLRATWEQKRAEVEKAATDCRNARQNCKLVTIPALGASDLPLQYTTECPAALEVVIPGSTIGNGSPDTKFSLTSGAASLATVAIPFVYQLKIKPKKDSTGYTCQWRANVRTANDALYEAETPKKDLAVPAGCTVPSGAPVWVETLKGLVTAFPAGQYDKAAPHLSGVSCSLPGNGPFGVAMIACFSVPTQTIKLPLINAQSMLPVQDLTTQVAQADTERKKKQADSMKSYSSRMKERTQKLRALIARGAPRVVKPKK